MPADYYNDMPEERTPSEERQPTEREKGEEGEEKTALIPSSLCPGMEVGDEVVLKITAIHDGEYEVAYAPEPGEGKRERYGQKPSMESAMKHNRSMSSFMED